MTSRWGIALALLVSLAPASLAAAQPAKPASAQARFDAAQTLFDKGKHDEALALFREVYGETKSPNARLMAARCLLALGKTADAYDELYATMREAGTRADKEAKYAKTRDAAAAEIAVLEPKIGKIVVASVDPTATVTLNGSALPAARIGVPMAMMPGSLVLVATKPGGATVRREETINAGDTKTITLVFPSNDAAPAATPAAPLAPRAPDTQGEHTVKSGGGVRIGGVVVTVLGAGGMAAFGATFAIAQSKYKTLETQCHSARCTDPKLAGVVDAGKQMELASDVSLGIGAAALVAGVTMIIAGGPKEHKVTAPTATLVVSPGSLRLEGAF